MEYKEVNSKQRMCTTPSYGEKSRMLPFLFESAIRPNHIIQDEVILKVNNIFVQNIFVHK